jgi:hypothetical protein
MQVKICAVVAVLLAAVYSTTLVGQTKAKFVSQDGGFSIDLPREGYRSIEPVGDLTSGAGTYAWVTQDGQFTVSYLEGAFSVEHAAMSLNKLADTIISGPANFRAQVLSRKQFSLNDCPAIDLRIKRSTVSAINRLVVVKRRLYVITADWVDGDGSSAARILDSFELIDGRLLIA